MAMRNPYLIALTSVAVLVLVGCGEKDEDNKTPASSTANSNEASEEPLSVLAQARVASSTNETED